MIVVTGANGFIGANVVCALGERGRAVVCVDDYASVRGGTHAKACSAPPTEVRYGEGLGYVDLHDLEGWLRGRGEGRGVRGEEVEAVVHLGACSDTTVTDREYVMSNNFEYTRMLWRWCAAEGKPFVYASSAATYGDGSQGYDDEADPKRYRPLNLYGESKQRFDLWALGEAGGGGEEGDAARHPLNAPPRWAGMKYFNVYGPREGHKGRMASVALHAFEQIGQTGKVRLFQSHKEGVADGGQRRDFVYVGDVVDMTLHLLDTPVSDAVPNGLYNAGTGKARTFEDLAKAVFAAMGRPPEIEYVPMPEDLRGKYQYFTQATTAKIRRAGYAGPVHSLEEGVGEYVRWLEGGS